MKQIILMRHAKSSWDDPDLTDFERPLAKRGLNDAPMMGRFLKEIDYMPDIIISSPAKRAKETITLAMEVAEIGEDDINWNKNLYYGDTKDYLKAICSVPEEAERVMLVGHNPLMESTAGRLTGAGDKVAFRMPTASVVCLESYVVRWNQVGQGTCQLKWMMIPKVLKKIFE